MALLVCGSSKPAREQLHRSEIEPDLAAGDGGLKVFGEAAVAVEPSEGSFDHPAARQDTRAGTIGPFDDLDSPPAVSGQCRGQLIAGIAAVGKDMAQPREQIADRRQQARCHRALARRPPASPTASSMDEIRIPCRAEVGLRRFLPVPVGPGERPFTEPTIAVRRRQRGPARHNRRLLTYSLASRLRRAGRRRG